LAGANTRDATPMQKTLWHLHVVWAWVSDSHSQSLAFYPGFFYEKIKQKKNKTKTHERKEQMRVDRQTEWQTKGKK
jgi:hypothetical protein